MSYQCLFTRRYLFIGDVVTIHIRGDSGPMGILCEPGNSSLFFFLISGWF